MKKVWKRVIAMLLVVVMAGGGMQVYAENCNHNYELTQAIPVACTTDGQNNYTCSKCGMTKTEIIPAIGHDYECIKTPATCTDNGFTTYTCSRCGGSYTSSGDAALGHNWMKNGNGSEVCSRCGIIKSNQPTSNQVGDIISYGSYPQTEVKDSATVAALNAQGGTWRSYGYYTGTGSYSDGNMKPSGYMEYTDVEYGGQKYRGVRFSQYRPTSTSDTSDSGNTYQDNNGYNQLNHAYWFRWEPLQWRVLNPDTGLVLCETIIDSQPYNNYTLSSGRDEYNYTAYWGDTGKTHYANNYAKSSIHDWLTKESDQSSFLNTAFTKAQREGISETTLDNSAYSSSFSAYNSASTMDKIFLLSYSDALNPAYGFSSSDSTWDAARRTNGTDYAKCQGLEVITYNYICSFWWLRSAGTYSSDLCHVSYVGSVFENCPACYTSVGIRPALRLNLGSAIWNPDDPISGDEPNKLVSEVTYDEDYYWTGEGFYGENAAVTDSLEFYVELENSVPIAPLNPSQPHVPKTFAPITMTVTTDADTLTFDMEGTQHSYSVTINALEEHQKVNDLILLYPQKGFSAEREYTVSITYSCADFDTITNTYTTYVHELAVDPIPTHLNFITNDSAYYKSKLNLNGQLISELRTDAEYQWSKYTSFDFDNYYQIVVADLLSGLLNTSQTSFNLIPNYIKNWKKYADSIREGLNTMIFDKYGKLYDVDELKIDKLFKCSKYTEDGIWTEDVLYKAVTKLFGNTDNVNQFTKVFASLDKLNMWVDLFKWGGDVLNETLDAINKLTLLESFRDADATLKDVVREINQYIPDSNKKMKDALNDYLNFDESLSARMKGYLQTICDLHGNVSMAAFKTVFGKKIIDYSIAKLVSWAGTIKIASGPLSSTAAFSTITSAASGVFTGVALGLTFSEILADSSDKAKEMAKAISMAEYAQYIVQTVSNAEAILQSSRSPEALHRFEYAFALHKAAQVYIAEHTIKALEYKRDSIVYKWFGDKKSADEAVEGQMNLKSMFSNMQCHSDRLPVVFTNTSTKRKVIAVKCPVNVSVYDRDGNEVARIVDNAVLFAAEGIECAIYESDKYILIPDTDEFDVKITATDNGTMTYSVSEWEDGELLQRYGKSDISLTKNQVFTGDIPKESVDDAQEYNLATGGKTIVVEPITNAEQQYTVTLNATGGTVSPTSITASYGTTVSLPRPNKTFTITYDANGGSVTPKSKKTENVRFMNWITKPDVYKPSYLDSITVTSDITLYANWFDYALAGDLDQPTRNGYVFDGWYTSKDGGEKVTSSSFIESDTTIYAHWREAMAVYVETNTFVVNKDGMVPVVHINAASGLNYSWSLKASNDNVVIDSNGRIKAQKAGRVEIKCVVKDAYGNITESAPVVLASIPSLQYSISGIYHEDRVFIPREEILQLKNDGIIVTSNDDTVDCATAYMDEFAVHVSFSDTGNSEFSIYVQFSDSGTQEIIPVKTTARCTWWQWLIRIFLFGWIWY